MLVCSYNPAYRSSELEYALNKVQCRVLVMARSLKSSDYVAILRSLAPELIYATAGERLRLANGDRRQIDAVGDVADGPDRGDVRARILVNDHSAA